MCKKIKYKPWHNGIVLFLFYVIRRKSTCEIAKILGCHHKTVLQWLKKFDIQTRSLSEARIGKEYRTIIDRMVRYIDKKGDNDCWNWLKCCSKAGYGEIRINGQHKYAHIVAFELFHNRVVKNGHCVHHKCGNAKCCNPKHLEEISLADHTSLHHRGVGKLNEEQVVEIKIQYKGQRGDITRLAEMYGVSICTISDIIHGRTWRHIDESEELNI